MDLQAEDFLQQRVDPLLALLSLGKPKSVGARGRGRAEQLDLHVVSSNVVYLFVIHTHIVNYTLRSQLGQYPYRAPA